jgi:endoglucanase
LGEQRKREAIALLKDLTEAHGVPGYEREVRDIFRRELPGPFQSDRLGSLLYSKKGSQGSPNVMLAAHTDEVGFMVQSITSDGMIRFVPLGGWWGHTLLAQRVRILNAQGNQILGVITSKPPHFLTADERGKVIEPDKMMIDVGATSDQDLRQRFGIRIGDPIAPESRFLQMHNPDLLIGKAFDDRAGVAMTIQIMQRLANTEHPNTVHAVATVQEEVGTRGAQTATHLCNPDFAIILEGTPADDLPSIGKDERQGEIGKGVQIRIMDPSAIAQRRFLDFVLDIAANSGIAHQIAVRRSGGTDARVIHLHHLGIPCVVFGIPARYIHTHNSIIDINDYLNAIDLIITVIQKLDLTQCSKLTDFTSD